MNKLTLFPLFLNFVMFFFFLLFGEPTRISLGWIGPVEVYFWIDKNFAIGAFVAIIVAIILMGLNVFSSGFSDRSIQLTLELTAYTGTWALMSIFTLPQLNLIPFLGPIIWSLLTVSYAVGAFMDLSMEGLENA